MSGSFDKSIPGRDHLIVIMRQDFIQSGVPLRPGFFVPDVGFNGNIDGGDDHGLLIADSGQACGRF
jgi:hypothetical protein